MFAVLDTNHFREVAQGADHADAIERRATEARLELFTTIVTVQEATAGWLALINRLTAGREQIRVYERFQATIAAFSKFHILPFDEEAANHFHRLQNARVRIGTMDLKIASICLAHDATLLTRNLVDFEKVPGLRGELAGLGRRHAEAPCWVRRKGKGGGAAYERAGPVGSTAQSSLARTRFHPPRQ